MSMEKIKREKILIVEDIAENIAYLATILEKNSYELIIAKNGEDALVAAKKTYPDLILLDIMMEGIDGYEVCKHLKLNRITTEIPVIFLTAKVQHEDIIKGFEAGAVDYIVKPFNSYEVLKRVEIHLELLNKNRFLKESDAKNRELVHILCHDLANPLGAASEMLRMIAAEKSYLETFLPLLQQSIDNGLSIIEMVRTMSSIESGKLLIENSKVDLNECIDIALSTVINKINNKKVVVEKKLDSNAIIVAEKNSLIYSVLTNLFTNAVKFSYEGGKVEVRVQKEKEKVVFMIKDHGIGIPESLLSRIFDISKPTTRLGTNGESGTGFGMPLVKQFLDEYGASISINSVEKSSDSENQGTEVIISFISAPN